MSTMRKIACIFMACLVLCMAAGCAGGPSEEDIRAIITRYESLDKYGMEITEYRLEEQSGSTVRAAVTARNDDLEYRASYTVECMQKDGAWVGHRITREDEAYEAINIISTEQIVDDMMEQYGDMILYEGLRDIEATVTDSQTVQIEPGEYPQIVVTAHCTARNDAYAYSLDMEVKYELSPRLGWHCMYANMNNLVQSPLS